MHYDAIVKFLSFEPLFRWSNDDLPEQWQEGFESLDWAIVGQQTPVSKKTEPRIEWIQEIVQAADQAGVPVFLKDNLEPLIFKDAISGQAALAMGLLNWVGELRQELPEGAAIRERIAK